MGLFTTFYIYFMYPNVAPRIQIVEVCMERIINDLRVNQGALIVPWWDIVGLQPEMQSPSSAHQNCQSPRATTHTPNRKLVIACAAMASPSRFLLITSH